MRFRSAFCAKIPRQNLVCRGVFFQLNPKLLSYSKADASSARPNLLVPYALFATFEMAPEYGIDVYQRVVDKVRIKNAVLARLD